MNLNDALKKAIADHLRGRITPQVDRMIQAEVLKELRRLGIMKRNAGREHANKKLSLVEGRDVRRRIGSLDTRRISNGIEEKIRVKLNGLQDRMGRKAISDAQLKELVRRAVAKYTRMQ